MLRDCKECLNTVYYNIHYTRKLQRGDGCLAHLDQ